MLVQLVTHPLVVCGPICLCGHRGRNEEMTGKNVSPDALAQMLALAMSSPVEELRGKIIQAGGEGYGYIGQVTDLVGNVVSTGGGDVFIHKSDLRSGELKVGVALLFTMIPSPQKDGCYKAVNAHTPDVNLVPVDSKVVFPLSIRTGKPSLWHVAAKKIDPTAVEAALNNKPFEDLPRPADEGQAIDFTNQENLAQAVRVYLMAAYSALSEFEVNFSIITDDSNPLDDSEEADRVGVFVEGLISDDMEAAGEDLRKKYQSFVDVREVYRYLYKKGLILPQTVVGVKHLSTILTAAPVVFVRTEGSLGEQETSDPMPSEFVKHLCSFFPNQAWANWVQIWNRRDRDFSQYRGEAIPPHIYQIIQEICKKGNHHLFDYVMIATPYTHLASQEWNDPSWQVLNDPFLIGIKKDLPDQIFILGRWSDTGVFPQVPDMMADVIDYLAKNKDGLSGFENPYWWQPGGDPNGCINGGHELIHFANKCIAHFEAGTLLAFLRGEIEYAASTSED